MYSAKTVGLLFILLVFNSIAHGDGNVTVTQQKNGDIIVSGDSASNEVLIEGGGGVLLRISGIDTRINGRAETFVQAFRDLRISLNGGNDSLTITRFVKNQDTPATRFQPGYQWPDSNIVIDGGWGNDSAVFDSCIVDEIIAQNITFGQIDACKVHAATIDNSFSYSGTDWTIVNSAIGTGVAGYEPIADHVSGGLVYTGSRYGDDLNLINGHYANISIAMRRGSDRLTMTATGGGYWRDSNASIWINASCDVDLGATPNTFGDQDQLIAEALDYPAVSEPGYIVLNHLTSVFDGGDTYSGPSGRYRHLGNRVTVTNHDNTNWPTTNRINIGSFNTVRFRWKSFN